MKKFLTVLPLAGIALSACVTINIYFPAAAAEKVADKIIDEVWQTEKTGSIPKSDKSPSAAPEIKKEKAI
jgi:hypothetical protein